MLRNLKSPGRSQIIAKDGMAATSHNLATEAAITILQSGGNAMDAAVAACAVQCVVEPQSTGIGGDCFCMFAPKGGVDYVAYNGSGRAPMAATADYYQKQAIDKIDLNSAHAVTIPGAVDAWVRLIEDHGTLPLSEILKPAIGYARQGYAITPRVSYDFARAEARLQTSDNAAKLFLPGGRLLKTGDIHHQPQLAATLEKIAEQGRDGFYSGAVAEDIVDYLKSHGGLHTRDDFNNAKGEYVTPISTKYKGYDVYQCPPNGQGIIALMLLKLIERFETLAAGPISVERIHQEIEAGRITYHQRDAYLADPDHSDISVEEMLSGNNIDRMYNLITDKAIKEMPDYQLPAHNDTVYITVVDKDRNCCSFINSLFHSFGSTLMAPKSGVMLQNRGAGFNLIPDHPNIIEGGKRPLHTIIPAMVASGGRTVMSFGVMGGAYQAFGHMQFLSRFLDYGYDIQQAMDMPRFFPNPVTGNVEVEGAISGDIIKALRGRGHRIIDTPAPIGGSQAIWINWDKNILIGGSDPRKDGFALGY